MAVRGRKPVLNRLSEVVNVPVTKADKSRLMELAAAKSITLAQLIRGKCLPKSDNRP